MWRLLKASRDAPLQEKGQSAEQTHPLKSKPRAQEIKHYKPS